VLLHLPKSDILVTNDFWVPILVARFRPSSGAVVVCAARFPKGQYFLYSRTASIVALSTAVRSAIVAEQPGLAERTVVIPLPVDVDALDGADNIRKNRDQTVLFVGRVHAEKGVELLVKAFALVSARFPEWRLKIVGPVSAADGGGGEKFGEKLRELARGLRVEFCGPIFDRAALAVTYREADLFCYPSLAERGEAFGVAPLESMAAGVPPIVSALECFGDFVRDGVNGWIFDHRAEHSEIKLADLLTRTMHDENLRKQVGEHARGDARRFSFSSVAKQYLDEFEKVLAAR
jgi:glycosyltransferase involved in cell wall biosynthesis